MKRLCWVVGLTCVTLALVLSACGDENEESAQTTAPVETTTPALTDQTQAADEVTPESVAQRFEDAGYEVYSDSEASDPGLLATVEVDRTPIRVPTQPDLNVMFFESGGAAKRWVKRLERELASLPPGRLYTVIREDRVYQAVQESEITSKQKAAFRRLLEKAEG